MRAMFGYNAEFDVANAYDGRHMFDQYYQGNEKYYTIKEGLQSITDRLRERLDAAPLISIKTGCMVQKVVIRQDGGTVEYIDKNFKLHMLNAACIVCAIPQQGLIQLFPEHKNILQTVTPVPLNRTYGFVDPTWLSRCPITTTNTHIRQFIPIDPHSGLSMISYTDTKDANYWLRYSTNEDLLNRKLCEMFPGFPGAQAIRHHYWDAGVHMWKKGYNSQELIGRITRLKGQDVPLFVVGEAYSDCQGWVEGALQTIHNILPDVLHSLDKQTGGRKPVLSDSDLKTLRQKGVLYVLLEDIKGDGRHKRIIDVTQWQHQHPGGSIPYHNHAYKDITSAFNGIPRHFSEGQEKYSKWMTKVLDKYTIGWKTK